MPAAEFLSSGLVALLAAWLGATVIARAPSDPGARVFAMMSGLLLVWAGSSALGQVTAPRHEALLRQVEDASAYLLPAVLLHLVVVLPAASRPNRRTWATIALVYVLTGLVALRAFIDPAHPFAVSPERGQFGEFGVPAEVYGWAWVGVRLGILALALAWAGRVLRRVAADIGQRRQVLAVLGALVIGTAGGGQRILPEEVSGPDWIGNLLLAIGLLFATYAVLAQRVFLDPDVARRAFASSLLGGLAITIYVGLLLWLDAAVQRALDLTIPVVTPLALALTVAFIGPIREAYQRAFGPQGLAAVRNRLVDAISGGQLTRQPPDAAIHPALARLSSQVGLSGAVLRAPDGQAIAMVGHDPASDVGLQLPLLVGSERLGTLTFGQKVTGLPLTLDEIELLTDGAAYIAGTVHLAGRLERQAGQLDALGRDNVQLDAQGRALHRAMLVAADPGTGLQVFALGPLRVQQGGQQIRAWGGRKAGSRQAEGLFAFLFDRGERGVAKDEILELVWPDVPFERADLAFHRTLNGLRHTLEPHRGRRSSAVIEFFNDRYHLAPNAVAWSDVAAFLGALEDVPTDRTPELAIEALLQARRLYRGEFLDDCPFYGDSAEVEDQRGLLRARYVDLLISLGEQYELAGDRRSASAAYRDALNASADECLPAAQALHRLESTPAGRVRT